MKHESRMSVLLTLIGLVSIFTYASLYHPPIYDPREIDHDIIGESIRIHGTVHDTTVKKDVSFITLKERKQLDIISFNPIGKLPPNTTVTIEGIVDIYHGNLEVVAKRVSQQNT